MHLLEKNEQLPKTGGFYLNKNGIIRGRAAAPVGLFLLFYKCKLGEHETRTPKKTLELRQ